MINPSESDHLKIYNYHYQMCEMLVKLLSQANNVRLTENLSWSVMSQKSTTGR